MRSTVLVLSGPDDLTAQTVVDELSKRSCPLALLDTGDFPQLMRLSARTDDSGRWSGRIVSGDTTVDLAEVSSIYYRRPTRFRFPAGLSQGDAVFADAEARLGLGGVLASLDVSWVNDPLRVAAAEYKPLQLSAAGRAGLKTPPTLVTNDHAELVEFAAEVGGAIVCKQMSALVLHDHGRAMITYTTCVDASEVDKHALAVTATQFQQWVPKAYEARVTMVGRLPLAVSIDSHSDASYVDWRRDYSSLTYRVIEPPAEVTAAMRRYLDALGLAYGAFDFVITPDNQWIMLECNPMGQWLWLEHEAGLPIADAFAELLVGGGRDDGA